MKRILMIIIGIGCISLLTSCSTTTNGCGGGCCYSNCGYYGYTSQCGAYSCTDNYQIIEYSNPCPGPYRCNIDMGWI